MTVQRNTAMRAAADVMAALLSITLIAFAFYADRLWLDRHFLPPFFVTRSVYILAAAIARTVLVGVALLVLFARPSIGRYVMRVPARILAADLVRILLAIGLALGVGEGVLRLTFRHSSEEQPASQVPYRRLDPHLGWVFVPGSTGRSNTAGGMIEYAFDNAGYRVRHSGNQVDPEKPSILFTGESIMVGQGLTYDETVPAQVEALLGIQSANLAVHGFSNDQAYLRLVAELPRFRQPVAVVSLFTPALFDRNLDDDRPHLSPDLVWQPAKPRWRLAMIASWLVPYRTDQEIERGISMTRAVLRATVDLARSRGAKAIIVVPQFTPEDPTEQVLRRRILDEPGLPCVRVELDPSWRLPIDRHPDARAAHAIAVALADRLRQE
jgi:hypothetical protein